MSKRLDLILAEVLDETVTITENGRRKKINKAKAIFKSLANDAARVDKRAAQILLRTTDAYAQRQRPKAGPVKAQNSEPAGTCAVVVLPHNGRDPIDPELLERMRE
jgi:hypothetical protein